ncbi:MAG TPA: ferredoxin [Bacillota bacterium]|jgi:ferredoxin|nr:ferredoxin [Candidatus Fermentithermobacillaceae bacterium]HOB30394.1 ferredoxin [Bacillota bacterium]HOK64357.1 ferredoxin [Bacillota bacterium]HOL11958.1 ferredoxin [Bacillota bacterium]HOQ03003.1 ferredoxin [Bacillota bacterium]
MPKIRIDHDLCIGCGLCVDTCPDVFELNDEGKAVVKENAESNIECAKEAAEICATEAIEIEE